VTRDRATAADYLLKSDIPKKNNNISNYTFHTSIGSVYKPSCPQQQKNLRRFYMKTLNIVGVLALLASAPAALADGFVCEATDADLLVKVYNQTDASEGTRNAAVMVLSNPSIQSGRKTIARFTDANGRITNKAATYSADVDLRFSDSARKGELIAGTKLGQLDTVELAVDFSYANPVEVGTHVEGLLTLNKRNGDAIQLEMDCVRYLKN
jgi:hypothetical protein